MVAFAPLYINFDITLLVTRWLSGGQCHCLAHHMSYNPHDDQKCVEINQAILCRLLWLTYWVYSVALASFTIFAMPGLLIIVIWVSYLFYGREVVEALFSDKMRDCRTHGSPLYRKQFAHATQWPAVRLPHSSVLQH